MYVCMQAELQVRTLPLNMCDPEVQPTLCPTIRNACADYPKLAQSIIKQNGLGVEEFNELQKKLDRNIFFRMKVQNEVKKIDKQRY